MDWSTLVTGILSSLLATILVSLAGKIVSNLAVWQHSPWFKDLQTALRRFTLQTALAWFALFMVIVTSIQFSFYVQQHAPLTQETAQAQVRRWLEQQHLAIQTN